VHCHNKLIIYTDFLDQGLFLEKMFLRTTFEYSGNTIRPLGMLPVDFIDKKCLQQSLLPVNLKKRVAIIFVNCAKHDSKINPVLDTQKVNIYRQH